MSRFVAQALAWLPLAQVPLQPMVQRNVGSESSIRIVTTEADRYDPYICEANGWNGCWAPSIVQEGPPYMGFDVPKRSKTCIIAAHNDPDIDDAPAILQAFNDCHQDGHIIFQNSTYFISSVLNTTGLLDVSVELRGTLLWDTNFDYWLANSLPIGFQNQTAAWHLGGENLHFFGHGHGTLHGNGQAWYDFNQGVSNRHGRPHALLITDTKNAIIEGFRFIQSQMWSMTVARSEMVLLQDIHVNNSARAGSAINTDGVDTVYANNITFLRWEVDNGDDGISCKQNSTNIYIGNSTFYNGMALAMGSIGQYPGQINVLENITGEDIRVINSGYAARIKTWTGRTKGSPPNGGGGGLGYARNITFKNFVLENVNLAWSIAQCTSYNGQDGDCDTSQFEISDIHWGNASGTLRGDRVAALQCSAKKPCHNIELFNNTFRALDQEDVLSHSFLCEQVQDTHGFECTDACNGRCPHVSEVTTRIDFEHY